MIIHKKMYLYISIVDVILLEIYVIYSKSIITLNFL